MMKKIWLALGMSLLASSAFAACTNPLAINDRLAASISMSMSSNADGFCQYNFNTAQINGVIPLMGNGVTGTGSQRVTVASDNTPFQVKALGNAGAIFDGATGAAVPANVLYLGMNNSGNLLGLIGDGTYGLWVNVKNANANGRAAVASASPVVPVAAASTAGAAVPNNTTAVVVKASAGTLFGVQIYGIGSAPAYLKIYNATSATCGSGTPVKRLMIPAAATAANGAGSNVTFGAGLAFGTGITYCVTTGIGDSDTTAPAASTFLVNVDYE